MKTALLHYWLTNLRGGEKVLAALGELCPEADVFTHAFGKGMRDADADEPRWRGHRVRESFIAHLPLGRRKPQMFLPFMPAASRRLDLSDYELLVSSESGPIKGVTKRADQRHVCYCHTPMRYVWDMHDDYYAAAGLGERLAMRLWTDFMRREDLRSVESVDTFVANSAFVAERIRRIYGRESTVVHPPVDVDFFRGDYAKEDYYLLAGELIAYKRPDLALAALTKMDRRIVVLGNGKLRDRLMRQYAGNANVTFLGRVDDAALKEAYGKARALVFPGVEDFGIVPVEAQAAGTPVIAFGRGGALETVKDGVSGLFFREPTESALCGAVEAFEARSWSVADCRAAVKDFGVERFKEQMRRILEGLEA